MKRVIFENGPVPTGFGFVNVAGSATFCQMCFGITMTAFSVEMMNCESGVFSVMTTLFGPFALTDAMFEPGRA